MLRLKFHHIERDSLQRQLVMLLVAVIISNVNPAPQCRPLQSFYKCIVHLKVQSVVFTSIHLNNSGSQGAGASPSCHRVRGRVPPGQVTSVSQR